MGVVAGEEPHHLVNPELLELAGALQHDSYSGPPRGARLRRVGAEHPDLTAVAAAVALHDFDGGRLAGAVGAEQREHLASGHREVQTINGPFLAVRLAQPPDHDRVTHGVHYVWPRSRPL